MDKVGLRFLFLMLLVVVGVKSAFVVEGSGDYVFAYTSDLVYNRRNFTGTYEYISVGGLCYEFIHEVDLFKDTRVIISRSVLAKTIIISFKGSDTLSDFITDVRGNQVACPFDSDIIDCGLVHQGFTLAYLSVRNDIINYMKKLDNSYDVYITGHSLGGSLGVLALVDILSAMRNSTLAKESMSTINLVTFGQPAVGDIEFNQFIDDNSHLFSYRRYVNYDNESSTEDPVVNLIPFYEHPNGTRPMTLACKKSCPSSVNPLGLHSLDLYKESLYSGNYSTCRTNCRFTEKRSSIVSYHSMYCMVSAESEIIVDVSGDDRFSLCVLSADEFSRYKYQSDRSCHVEGANQTTVTPPASLYTGGFKSRQLLNYSGDSFVVVENHNKIFPAFSLSYDISLSQFIAPADPPANIDVQWLITPSNNNGSRSINGTDTGNGTASSGSPLPTMNDTLEWTITWEAPKYFGISTSKSNSSNIQYNIYFSVIGGMWTHIHYIEPIHIKSINKTVKGIPFNRYAIVMTTDNSLESHPSSIIYINP
ncbi:hypothetical protein SAMD00019534_100400, partial [Acytostelium subglobosum LB1]|uniref:hypothetical protein n=1 Tax=Acytostelium subglobosum LB1 TaxID=1410327 RepID=UPI0006447F93